MTCRFAATLLIFLWAPLAAAQSYPAPVDADFIARHFTFASGETMPEVRLHYRTIGTPRKDADGVVRNAVLILHGTGGTGAGFLSNTFAGRLFGKSISTTRNATSADDFVNPPELPLMEALIKQVKRGRFVLLPISDQTAGHGTHSRPAVWGDQVAAFLQSVRR